MRQDSPTRGCRAEGADLILALPCRLLPDLGRCEQALYSEMPPFLFLPKQNRVQAEQGIYECPLYKVSPPTQQSPQAASKRNGLPRRCSREPERSRQPATQPTS